MNKNTIIGAVIGIVIGIGGTASAAAVMNLNKDNVTTTTNTSSMTMAQMNKDLINKKGDDFDKAFISMMIEHHQGAIDMASLASSNAKHDEIKLLSKAIISAQTTEITQMQKWQMDWSYVDMGSSMPGMNH